MYGNQLVIIVYNIARNAKGYGHRKKWFMIGRKIKHYYNFDIQSGYYDVIKSSDKIIDMNTFMDGYNFINFVRSLWLGDVLGEINEVYSITPDYFNVRY